jgi:hypothetical protein
MKVHVTEGLQRRTRLGIKRAGRTAKKSVFDGLFREILDVFADSNTVELRCSCTYTSRKRIFFMSPTDRQEQR